MCTLLCAQVALHAALQRVQLRETLAAQEGGVDVAADATRTVHLGGGGGEKKGRGGSGKDATRAVHLCHGACSTPVCLGVGSTPVSRGVQRKEERVRQR